MRLVVNFLVLIVGLFLVFSMTVKAQDSSPVETENAPVETSYTGLDILFIVDHSGSMGGARYGYPDRVGNDPLDLRFVGPQYALRRLLQFQESLSLNNVFTVNVSMIGFGDSTRRLLSWTRLEPDDGNWDMLTTSLTDGISPERFGNVHLGNTNFLGAFNQARLVFEELSSPGPLYQTSDERRMRAIVLLTDGGPCVPSPEDPNCSSLPRINQHMLDLQSNMEAYFPRDYILYIMALDANNEYWFRLGLNSAWATTVCVNYPACTPEEQARLVQNEPEIAAQFNAAIFSLYDIIAPNRVSTYPITEGSFLVQPYRQLMQLDVLKRSISPLPANAISLLDPLGNRYVAGTPEVVVANSDTPIETYAIAQPIPGEWQLEINDPSQVQNVSFLANFISADVRLEFNGQVLDAINPPAPIQMYEGMAIKATIVDGAGTALPIYPDIDNDPSTDNSFDLTVSLVFVNTVTGERLPPIVLNRGSSEFICSQGNLAPMLSDLNIFSSCFYPQAPGIYQLRLSASYRNLNAEIEYLISDAVIVNELLVNESYFSWRGLDPVNQLQGEPVVLRVDALAKGSDQPLSQLENILLDVEVRSASTGEVILTTEARNQSSQAGLIEAEFILQEAGDYLVTANAVFVDGAGQRLILDSLEASPVSVRPYVGLNLRISSPTEAIVVAEEIALSLQPVKNTPLRLVVEIVTDANEAVSLAYVTDNQELLPNLLVESNNVSRSLSENLREIASGVYAFESDAFGQGNYNFTASVLTPTSSLIGDFRWNNTSVSFSQERRMNIWIVLIPAGFILTIIGTTVGIISYRAWYQKVTKSPLRGTITIWEMQAGQDLIVRSTIPLEPRKRNEITLTAKRDKLPRVFDKIVLSTLGMESNSHTSTIVVKEIRFEGQKNVYDPPRTLGPGGELTFITKENNIQYIVRQNEGILENADPASVIESWSKWN